MDKPAHTKYGIHSLLKKRWSPRAFSDKPVETEKLQRIFEAASWAPSSFNEQPWRFIVGIKGNPSYDKLFKALLPFNQGWAHSAPVLVFILSKKTSGFDGSPNNVHRYDGGQAAAYLTFQATEEGLYVHQMGGIDRQQGRASFDIPEDYAILTGAAIGYKGHPEILPADLHDEEKADRDRKSLDKLVFEGDFGNPAGLTKKDD